MLVAWLAVSQSCKATPPTAPDSTLVGISVLYSLPFEPEFPSAYLYAFAVDSDGGYTDVTGSAQWSSSDPRLVNISSANLQGRFISINGVGPFRILVTYQGVAGELLITRQPFPLQTTMLLSGRAELRGIGATLQLQADVLQPRFERVTNVATWTSTDPAVATVEQGRIAARSIGTTEVRASYQGASRAYVISVLPGSAARE